MKLLKPNIDKTQVLSVSAAYRDITSFIGLGLFDENSVLFPLVVPCKKASHVVPVRVTRMLADDVTPSFPIIGISFI